MKLVSVYEDERATSALFALLQEREPNESISHRSMPTLSEHVRFMASMPYDEWYVVIDANQIVGTVYLTRHDEIGVMLFKRFQGLGIGPAAVEELMRRHPRQRYLANINPMNERSIEMFETRGFKLLQHTYEFQGRAS